MRLIRVRFRIRLYIGGYLYFGISMYMCCWMDISNGTFWWIFTMDLSDGSLRWIFPCPVEAIPDSRVLRYVRCYNHHLCVDPKHPFVEVCDYDHVVQLFTYYHLIFLASFLFLLPFFSYLGLFLGTNPMPRSLNLLKIDPWFGLVSKSLVISPVEHHSTNILPLRILSII